MRLLVHQQLQQWMLIYMGKSRHVGKRINEHILPDISRTPFTMKFRARTNRHNETFRISAIKLKISNYDTIMPKIENALRKSLNPIIGKQ